MQCLLLDCGCEVKGERGGAGGEFLRPELVRVVARQPRLEHRERAGVAVVGPGELEIETEGEQRPPEMDLNGRPAKPGVRPLSAQHDVPEHERRVVADLVADIHSEGMMRHVGHLRYR